jgi:hypothetical protein
VTDKRIVDLPELDTERNQHRNLCVQLEQDDRGFQAELIDLEAFRGCGSTEAGALEDLAADLTRTAAAIRRHRGAHPMEEWFHLAERVFVIASSDVHDESKYDLIFTDGLRRRLSEIRYLEYYDPDGSYGEDVAAYVAALQRQYDDLSKVRHAFMERQ